MRDCYRALHQDIWQSLLGSRFSGKNSGSSGSIISFGRKWRSLYLSRSNLEVCVDDYAIVLVLIICSVARLSSAELPHTNTATSSTNSDATDCKVGSVQISIRSEL